jgi:hypothetical protein
MRNIKMELRMNDFIVDFLICPLTNKKTHVY